MVFDDRVERVSRIYLIRNLGESGHAVKDSGADIMNLLTTTTVLLCTESAILFRSWNTAIGQWAQVAQAEDCEQALERAFLDNSLLLILLDTDWLQFDGARLIRRLRGEPQERLADMPIFLIEQSGQAATAELWLREGADGVLSARHEHRALRVLLSRLCSQPDRSTSLNTAAIPGE
jgi:CheY-like chemotaxis protein